MNRRDFAKGLAALPLLKATSFAQICASGSCTPNPNALRILIQGPFALVMNSSSPWNITAFTPKHNGEHMFAFNGSVCDKDAKYAFQLQQDGLMPADPMHPPCVDNSFPTFCVEKTPFDRSVKDHFITIDLPAPQRIFVRPTSGNLMAITEDSAMKPIPVPVPVPGDRVLEYDNPDLSKIRMLGSGDGDLVQLPFIPASSGPQPTPPLFIFEVGLPNLLGGRESDPDASHAIDFYNNSLLPHFSALAHDTKRRIQDITPHAPNVHQAPQHPHGPLELSVTTFECKIGGLTVTSP
jgi:hypothetical protein